MDRIKMARLAKYLADNDIDLHEAVQVLQEAIRQMVLARLNQAPPDPQRTAKVYGFRQQEEVRK